ncbi:MAG: Uncharacterized protein FD134_1872 [Gallionellaceae bacterium]|nr:MAG: Uncharacterized protein FD134_1872 [Gallionellaceae bacterium]
MGYPKLFFDNRFADAAPAASSTAAGNYAAANIADMRSYTWWRPAALPATLTVDCGQAKAADFALIYGHDLFTQGASVEVRGSTDNFSISDEQLAAVTPASDAPFLLEFSSASYRYWRIRITGTSAPSVAIAMIGAALVMPRYLGGGFDPLARSLVLQANHNDNGHPLGKIIEFERWQQTLSFGLVSWGWLRGTWQPAWRGKLRGQPFVFAWDSVNYPAELQLVTAGDNYQTPHQTGLLASLQFDVSGVAT